MGKKTDRPAKTGAALDELMYKAKTIYMEKLGKVSDSHLARLLGVHRVTVGKWRKAGGWNVLATELLQAADKKTTERATSKYLEQMDIAFEEMFANLRLLNLAIRKRIMEVDDRGRPILDASGQPNFNPKMTSTDIRNYAGTMETYQRMYRLQAGKSTQNTDSRVSGEMVAYTKDDELFEKALRQIAQHGDADGQDALQKYVEAHQHIVGKYEGDE